VCPTAATGLYNNNTFPGTKPNCGLRCDCVNSSYQHILDNTKQSLGSSDLATNKAVVKS
jgi:hypothetical protein